MPTYTEQDELSALQAYASQGDPQAFEVLVRRYQGMVYATCRRQLGNTTDAEDATQETFLKLARKAGAIRSSLAAWLHTCAVGTSKDLIRRHATRRKHELEAGKAVSEPAADSWEQLGPVVDEAMQSLPKGQRDLLVERFLVGVPQTEIAEREGVSPSAIHQRVNRAVETLRKKLTRRGIPVAAVALGTLMAGAAEASVPQAVTASAMKIGLAGVTAEPSGSVLSSLIEQLLEASLMTKLTATAAAITLIVGSTVTVNQLRSASPPSPPPAAASTPPAATALANNPETMLDGTWENLSWKVDNKPATAAVMAGRHIKMSVPSFIPGGEPIEMTLEILETDPDAKPGKIVYKLIGSNSPMIPVTDVPVEASYGVVGNQFKLAINHMGGERPDSLETVPGRWVLACKKEDTGKTTRMADGLDPALAGTWSGFLPFNFVIKDGLCTMQNKSGDVISETEVLSFDPTTQPMRLEMVITVSTEMPALVGKKVCYLVDLKGDKVIYANHDARSPKADQYPRDFKGKKGDQLNTTVWQRVDEE